MISEELISQLGLNIQAVVKNMSAGVAFMQANKKRYSVFSHEGDYIADHSVADVLYAIHFMKANGIAVGKLAHDIPSHPGFTFAWSGWYKWPDGRGLPC